VEKTIEVGGISFFVANPIYGNVELSKEDSAILAKEFEDGFRDRFSKSPLHEFFTITSFKWRLGCLEGIFCFGVLGALITGIIAYPQLKQGILEIYKDYTWLRSKLTKRLHPVRLRKDELYSDEEIIKAIEDLRSKEK